ncbi:hypothetical protein [Haloglomus litoreum]|uniref:hypothetical protein n=1 Tax=Haloglomus litoreum TaxID=3034026 RepID=UPI0023E8579F|nr:hypothetical protein [Haloglomus sp. DT116]
MVVVELLEAAVGFLFDQFGIGGVSVGAVALLLAGLWYSRELSSLLIGGARWLRIGSVVAGVLAIGAVAGIATGALSLDSGVVAQLLELLGSLAGGL